ncbi:MAG: ABC transporter ATP-binding protein [Bryobacteraceae bacterium]
MLEARGLAKRYEHTPAVEGISFSVRPGEVLGYLGPNGSGKSTTVNMLTGLLDPTRGQVFFEGRDIREDIIGYKRRVGYVPEIPYVYPFLTGREYLQLVGRLRSMPEPKLGRTIDDLLELLALYSERHSPIASYSKGMTQKILISAALLADPDVLIFDEPLSGLDTTTALMFRSLIERLAGEGKIILYSSHVLDVVEKVCSKVVILHRGRIVAYDSVERLRDLMRLPSLESIFAQLVEARDIERVASDLVAVMKGA